MKCRICQNEFTPNKYHPKQQVCTNPACQRVRQLENMKIWRQKNPDYFKSLGQEKQWREVKARYHKLWGGKNKEYLKKYAEAHRAERSEYMRNYMRRYRQNKKQKEKQEVDTEGS
ncbi:MAG: hypothetical protein N2606_03770 [Candidatus Omnitrophica bacterium]|nr:hypothetical protein [Candidatus Omnitrophota bacterium]